MMLNEYPKAISETAQSVNHLEFQIAQIKQRIADIEGSIDFAVAQDGNLKNDHQRKAQRFELLRRDQDYQNLLGDLNQMATAKSNALAHLEQLRNEFSVAKLEVRLAIAQKLTGLESRELVGM